MLKIILATAFVLIPVWIFGQNNNVPEWPVYPQYYNPLIALQSDTKHSSDSSSQFKSGGIQPPNENEIFLKQLDPFLIFSNRLEQLKRPLNLISGELKTQPNIKKTLFGKQEGSQKGRLVSIQIDAYASNIQLPFTLSENKYVRVSGNPGVNIMGLPFVMDFYYTTEKNQLLSNSSLGFRFDIQEYQRKLSSVKKETLTSNLNQVKDLKSLDRDIEIYKKDLERIEKQMEVDAKIKLEQNKAQIEKQTFDLYNHNNIKSEYKSAVIDTLNNSLGGLDDSTKLKRDSLLLILTQQEQKLAKELATLKTYKARADTLSELIRNAIELCNKTSMNVQEFDKPNFNDNKLEAKATISDSMSKLKTKFDRYVRALENFEVGLFNPFYSKNSLNAIPVKGFNFRYASPHSTLYYEICAGLTLSRFSGFEVNELASNIYERRLISSKIGFGKERGDNIYFVSLFSWDPTKETSAAMNNAVNGVGFSYSIGKFTTKSELLYSYTGLRNANRTNEAGFSPFSAPLNNIAALASLSYSPDSKTKLTLLYDQKNFGFRSFGSPYLRNDYLMTDLILSRNFFKNKIQTTGFYKIFDDNLSGLNSANNRMRGFGVTARFAIKNYPNLFVSYNPVEFSTTNPSYLERNYSKFESLLIITSFQKTIDKHFFYSTASYNSAMVEYSNNNAVIANTNIFNFTQLYKNDKLTSSVAYTLNKTNPAIDSLNFQSITFSCSRNYKFLNIGFRLQNKYSYSNGIYTNYSFSAQCSPNKNFILRLTAGMGKIEQMWEMNNQRYVYGLLTIKYIL